MSKKLMSLFSVMMVAALMITGCGQSDKANNEQKENVTKENKEEKKIHKKKRKKKNGYVKRERI